MNEATATTFSHVKPGDTGLHARRAARFLPLSRPRRRRGDEGQGHRPLVKANLPPVDGTGWHYHVADFQIVIMMKGWAKFMYEDKVTLVEAGDCVHQRPGMTHYLFDYSPDMEYLEIVGPADFGTVDAEAAAEVPHVTPWT